MDIDAEIYGYQLEGGTDRFTTQPSHNSVLPDEFHHDGDKSPKSNDSTPPLSLGSSRAGSLDSTPLATPTSPESVLHLDEEHYRDDDICMEPVSSSGPVIKADRYASPAGIEPSIKAAMLHNLQHPWAQAPVRPFMPKHAGYAQGHPANAAGAAGAAVHCDTKQPTPASLVASRPVKPFLLRGDTSPLSPASPTNLTFGLLTRTPTPLTQTQTQTASMSHTPGGSMAISVDQDLSTHQPSNLHATQYVQQYAPGPSHTPEVSHPHPQPVQNQTPFITLDAILRQHPYPIRERIEQTPPGRPTSLAPSKRRRDASEDSFGYPSRSPSPALSMSSSSASAGASPWKSSIPLSLTMSTVTDEPVTPNAASQHPTTYPYPLMGLGLGLVHSSGSGVGGDGASQAQSGSIGGNHHGQPYAAMGAEPGQIQGHGVSAAQGLQGGPGIATLHGQGGDQMRSTGFSNERFLIPETFYRDQLHLQPHQQAQVQAQLAQFPHLLLPRTDSEVCHHCHDTLADKRMGVVRRRSVQPDMCAGCWMVSQGLW